MRNAETILRVIQERGRRGLPLERLYRLLYNPNLYLLAYSRIYRNSGAMTPGITPETVDGMSQAKIATIIEQLRYERYRWTPVRRVYIEKQDSKKKRPLGVPSWSDKLLQEVIRLILEAYYEPQFSSHSHGFRPKRGCHTALTEIQKTWTGTAWFIEGDISQCFDSLDHSVLVAILGERIHDNRFLRLISGLLKAGYLEGWTYHTTLSGSPQGSGVSPILANLYLDKLDKYAEQALLPSYNRGTERRVSAAYQRLRSKFRYRRSRGRLEKAAAIRKLMRRTPSRELNDPNYRRLRYVRYADDILLGFCGPRHEAEEIKRRLGTFLHDELKLTLSDTKTLITHARSQAARFLGYEIVTLQNDHKRDGRGYRSLNGSIGLKVPAEVVRAKCRPYMRHGKPVHLTMRMLNNVYSIVAQYQQEYRGIVEYYRLAYNLHRFNRLRWVMEQSLTKTLARKLRLTVNKVYRRYLTTVQTPDGPRKVLRVCVARQGKPALRTHWGGISLRRQQDAVLIDTPSQVWNARTELVERLLADTCEHCGTQGKVEVHHVRRLRDLQRHDRPEKPAWVQVMAARQRKTLVVCNRCHNDIHAGRANGSRKPG